MYTFVALKISIVFWDIRQCKTSNENVILKINICFYYLINTEGKKSFFFFLFREKPITNIISSMILKCISSNIHVKREYFQFANVCVLLEGNSHKIPIFTLQCTNSNFSFASVFAIKPLAKKITFVENSNGTLTLTLGCCSGYVWVQV